MYMRQLKLNLCAIHERSDARKIIQYFDSHFDGYQKKSKKRKCSFCNVRAHLVNILKIFLAVLYFVSQVHFSRIVLKNVF